MSDSKIEVTLPDGSKGKGVEVQVQESTERWSEFTLEDGAIIRLKAGIVSAIRSEDQYDAKGNPTYILNMAPSITVVSAPDQYKKKD